jgi:DNA-binding Lrp family transcriptional regulator
MGYFKNLEVEIREMDFDGVPLQQIADRVGLSVPQVLEILDQIDDDDLVEYAENAADLDADFYGRV